MRYHNPSRSIPRGSEGDKVLPSQQPSQNTLIKHPLTFQLCKTNAAQTSQVIQ